jgi:Cof subfamily protein (haloacid dehalogenase superfamily)
MEYERKFVNGSYWHTTLKTELPFGLHNAACESPHREKNISLYVGFMPQTPHHSDIKLVVTDVDGTFITKTREITPLTQRAVEMLHEQGIMLVLASSRPLRGMEFILEASGLMRLDVPVVSMNGALITTTRGLTHFSSLLEAATIRTLYDTISDLVQSKRINFMLLDAQDWWSSGDDDLVRREAASLRFEPKIANDVELHERMNLPANKVTLLGIPEAVSEAKQRIREVFGKNIAATNPASPKFLDITAPNVHKGTALTRLATHFGLEYTQICALGDGENDVDMFRVAKTSVAMGHASDFVKGNATHLTTSHAEDGWGKAIFEIFG